jgi:hypothetical protein
VALMFALGVALMLMAPLLRRYRKASSALAGGAFIILALAFFGLIHPDARSGQAAIESNRRFYQIVLAVELPVLILALISLRYFKCAFWLGRVCPQISVYRYKVKSLTLNLGTALSKIDNRNTGSHSKTATSPSRALRFR